ncbi:MAG: serine/threonine protein kinase [Planctomycetes bacterium]|nr:serine/threonine protein kinase [Planctomycetota bacterium]
MSTTSKSGFSWCALASGLLTQEQVDEAIAALAGPATPPPPGGRPSLPSLAGDQQLADKLMELGHLNRWQAEQLMAGRTKFNLGPYQVIDSIGQGGMGQVFKAKHEILGRVVAVKVLPRSESTPEAVASFTREIKAQAKLDHAHLVAAVDAGHDGNVHFLVTEYVPGTDLHKYVRQHGALDMKTAATIISDAARGLQYAHEEGLIHRDVKPGNVLVTPEGRAKLSDLGLAGPLAGDAENDPRFGKIVGTADYLSPDHIDAPWNPTPAWDIYSLGCTLYYAVTRKVPFPGGSTRDKAEAHRKLEPLAPQRLNPGLSDEFAEVLHAMMAKDPAERIASAAEVVERLAPWTGQSATMPTEALPTRPGGRKLADTKLGFPELSDATPKEAVIPMAVPPTARHPASQDDSVEETEDDLPPLLHPVVVLVLAPLAFSITMVVLGMLLKSAW